MSACYSKRDKDFEFDEDSSDNQSVNEEEKWAERKYEIAHMKKKTK